MSRIESLPDFDWTDQARKEILLTGQNLLNETDFAFSVGDVAVCGLIYPTFSNPPWFWFALARGITLRHLIDFRRLARHIPVGTYTAVEDTFEVGIRFAKFYGFEDTEVAELQGQTVYKIFRRV